MLTLPSEIITLMTAFAPLFSPAVFQQAQVLLVGALLTPGQRTVTAALRAMGLSHTRQFQNYHRVLNRATWCPRQAAQMLLTLLLQVLAPTGPLLIGVDDTIERRRGHKIAAKGIYRDPVRSSHSHFVKTSGLRWLALMLLVPVPFAKRVWALPFLTLLAPSERYQQAQTPQRQKHKTLVDWTRQGLLQVRRWLPQRPLVVVADASFAVIELLASVQRLASPYQPITMITRLRLDAALYEPAPPPPVGKKSRMGRPRHKGLRLPTLQQRLDDPHTVWQAVSLPQWYQRSRRGVTKARQQTRPMHMGPRLVEITTGTAVWYHTGQPTVPLRWVLVRDPAAEFMAQAFLCTDLSVDAVQIVQWFVHRWQVEVTFREVREHLGVETQRQWNAQAIVRTTPVLLGLFSLVTLLAQRLVPTATSTRPVLSVRQSAWYLKAQPTFSDALASVRRYGWGQAQLPFCISELQPDREKLQQALLERMTDLLCYTT